MDFFSSVYNAAARGARAAWGDPDYIGPKLALTELMQISESLEQRMELDRPLFKRIDRLLWVLTNTGATQLEISSFLQIDRIYSHVHEVYRRCFRHTLDEHGELAPIPKGLNNRQLLTDIVRRCRTLKQVLLKPMPVVATDEDTLDELQRTQRAALAAMRRIEELQEQLSERDRMLEETSELQERMKAVQATERDGRAVVASLKEENKRLCAEVIALRDEVALKDERIDKMRCKVIVEAPVVVEAPQPAVVHEPNRGELHRLRTENASLAEENTWLLREHEIGMQAIESARDRQMVAEIATAEAQAALKAALADHSKDFTSAQEVATAFEAVGVIQRGQIKFTGALPQDRIVLQKMFGLIGSYALRTAGLK